MFLNVCMSSSEGEHKASTSSAHG